MIVEGCAVDDTGVVLSTSAGGSLLDPAGECCHYPARKA